MTLVKKYRESLGMTQAELAKVVGCSAGTINRMESSDRKNRFTIQSACLVADALGQKIEHVFWDMELNHTQGRPVGTGGPTRRTTIRTTRHCSNCRTEASAQACDAGVSECCDVALTK